MQNILPIDLKMITMISYLAMICSIAGVGLTLDCLSLSSSSKRC